MKVSSCHAPYKGCTRAAVPSRWHSAAVYRVLRDLRWLQPVRAAGAGARKPSRSPWGALSLRNLVICLGHSSALPAAMTLCHLSILFGKMCVWIFCPFFCRIVCFLIELCILGKSSLSDWRFAHIFFWSVAGLLVFLTEFFKDQTFFHFYEIPFINFFLLCLCILCPSNLCLIQSHKDFFKKNKF